MRDPRHRNDEQCQRQGDQQCQHEGADIRQGLE
jgi:hypothetical protein